MIIRVLLLVLALATGGPAFAAVEVGHAVLVSGAVYGQLPDEGPRLLDREAPVYRTETIRTASDSFAVLKLEDGTKITLRPASEFRIDEYDYPGDRPKATYSLVGGGLRALTGLIGKGDPRANLLRTRVGSMGIRGTEFDARLCDEACSEEELALSEGNSPRSTRSEVIGRVILVRGDATAERLGRTARALVRGGPVYEADLVATSAGAFVVIAFRDGSRLSLRPESEVNLARYRYEPEGEGLSAQTTELVKGGLRALTGLIAREEPGSVRFSTREGALGIRGTGFDTYYEEAVYVHVWRGGVLFCRRVDGAAAADSSLEQACLSGVKPVDEGQTLMSRGDDEPLYLDEIPEQLRWPDETRPDLVEADVEALFAVRPHDFTQAGLLVSVYDGHVTMYREVDFPAGTDIREALSRSEGMDIGAGESLFTDGDVMYRLEQMPLMQYYDPTIRPGVLPETNADAFGLFPALAAGGGDLCTLQ